MQALNRTRPTHGTACRTCRRRGRKCDKTLPACQSCKGRGILCEGYVTRWPGIAARGRFAGKTIPVECDSYSSPKASIKRPEPKPRDDLSVVNNTSLEYTDGLDGLIEYYAHELSTVFYLGSTPTESPYSLYIIPMARTVLPLRYTIAASASCHLATRFRDDALETQSRELRLKAVELLRERLGSELLSTDFGTLASMLMMAQLDMCSGDCVEFDTHLPAAKALLDSHVVDMTDRSFFEQRLAWLDIMRSTTSSRLPTFTSTDVKNTINRYGSSEGREWGCDVFPCPIDLFEYIADITMLYKLQPHDQLHAAAVVDKATRLGGRVSAWTSATEYFQPKSHVVDAYHAGIVLYVIRLFRLRYDEIFNVESLRNVIFMHAKAVPTASSWSYSMLWPLFQAGLWVGKNDSKEQCWLRDRLETMLRAVGCRQFGNARDTLDIVWKSDEYYNSITAGMIRGPLMLA